jgi:hypothetical protein
MSAGGRSRWFEPEDVWPSHGESWFREALDVARRRGWKLRSGGGSSHIYGTVFCPAPAGSSPHKYVVFSTGRGGESAARELQRLVADCAHLADAARSILAEAEDRIEKAESLLLAAEALIDKDSHEQAATALWVRAEELLDAVAENAEEANELMEKAEEHERNAAAAGVEAESELRGSDEAGLGAEALAGRIADVLEPVGAALRRPGPRDQIATLKIRLKSAKDRLRSLRARLSLS